MSDPIQATVTSPPPIQATVLGASTGPRGPQGPPGRPASLPMMLDDFAAYHNGLIEDGQRITTRQPYEVFGAQGNGVEAEAKLPRVLNGQFRAPEAGFSTLRIRQLVDQLYIDTDLDDQVPLEPPRTIGVEFSFGEGSTDGAYIWVILSDDPIEVVLGQAAEADYTGLAIRISATDYLIQTSNEDTLGTVHGLTWDDELEAGVTYRLEAHWDGGQNVYVTRPDGRAVDRVFMGEDDEPEPMAHFWRPTVNLQIERPSASIGTDREPRVSTWWAELGGRSQPNIGEPMEWTPVMVFNGTPASWGEGDRAMAQGWWWLEGPKCHFTFRFEADGSGIVTPGAGDAFLAGLPVRARGDMDVLRIGQGSMFDPSNVDTTKRLSQVVLNGGELNGKLGLPPGTVPTDAAVFEFIGVDATGTITPTSPWSGGITDGATVHGSGWYWVDPEDLPLNHLP